MIPIRANTYPTHPIGKLGNDTDTDSSTPVQVMDPNDPSGYLSGVQAIAARDLHSMTLKDDGTVWAWGFNRAGQLGNGTTTDSSTPVQVGNLDGVKAIAAGSFHSLALKNDGTVWAWGGNFAGQLGNGTTTDILIAAAHARSAASNTAPSASWDLFYHPLADLPGRP